MDVEGLVSKSTELLTVSRAFGPAIERDGVVIVPVALVAGGGGGGEQPHAESNGAGPGTGGGYGGVTRPLGVYVIKDGRVRWVPAINATLVVLGALALARSVVKAVTIRHLAAAHRSVGCRARR